jgi:uncharacterized protein YijF (DUF1287 family)
MSLERSISSKTLARKTVLVERRVRHHMQRHVFAETTQSWVMKRGEKLKVDDRLDDDRFAFCLSVFVPRHNKAVPIRRTIRGES